MSQDKIMTITKADIVDEVYKSHPDLAKSKAKSLVEAYLRIIKNTLISGEDVLLSGFGKFKVNDKKARRGRNPQTGEALLLEPRRVITFTPSGLLRKRVRES